MNFAQFSGAMLGSGGTKTYAELRPRQKLDFCLNWLMTQSAGAFANPIEFREKMIEWLQAPLDAPAEGEMAYDEIPGKGGTVIRVPKADPSRHAGPITQPKLSDITPAKAKNFKALLDQGLGAI